MSHIHPTGTSPDPPIPSDARRDQGESGPGTTATTPSTLSGTQRSITRNSITGFRQECSSNNVSPASSPSLDRNFRRSLPAEGQEYTTPVHSALDVDDFNQGANEDLEEPSSSAGYSSEHLRRPAEAQHQLLEYTLANVISASATGNGSSGAVSPTGRLQKECEEQRKKQGDVPIVDGPSSPPKQNDFPSALSLRIVDSAHATESCIILMHSLDNNEASLESLVQILKRKQPETALLLLRGLKATAPRSSGYHWTDSNDTMDEGFINTSRVILEDVIRDVLMAKCKLHPRNIVLLGHGQGGMAALATTACWNCIEFGGVVSLGASMPTYFQLQPNIKAKTPALIYSGAWGDITPAALQQIQGTFSSTDCYESTNEDDGVPSSDEDTAPLLDFLAHRLRREEWKRQAVISFDGGGIRGYGSLLILQELMNKIGNLEKRLDGATESSFSPSDYKPTTISLENPNTESANPLPPVPSEGLDASAVVPTKSHDLPNSALFLPCHYFNYAAGTSTGGLISIMISRFRMTVDDCIEEYKTLGKKIFKNPRRMAVGGFPWHKFSAKVLEEVIRKVTSRHNMRDDIFEALYGLERSDEDMSQCVVLAYSDHDSGGEFPFLFRTYANQSPPLDSNRPQMRQQTFQDLGSAAKLPIWKVARATSAAPGFFPQIKIKTGHGSEVIKFSDGGFGANNPSEYAYKDILLKHGSTMHMGPFISIGTGSTKLERFGKRSDNLSTLITNVKTAFKYPSRTLGAHQNMCHHAEPPGEEVKFPYFRFDGGAELGKVGLGDWKSHRFSLVTGEERSSGYKTLDKIETAIKAYLRDPNVNRRLDKCAEILVKRRRLQTRDSSRWDRYASYSHYECNMKGCPKPSLFNTAHDFKEHLLRFHQLRVADPVIEQKIRQCRRVRWIYPP